MQYHMLRIGITTMRQTCFVFEVDSERLEGALSRFSRFFTAPYFNRECVGKESMLYCCYTTTIY